MIGLYMYMLMCHTLLQISMDVFFVLLRILQNFCMHTVYVYRFEHTRVYTRNSYIQLSMHTPLLILINIYKVSINLLNDLSYLPVWVIYQLYQLELFISNWTNCLRTYILSTLCIVFPESITVRTFTLFHFLV